MLSANGVWEAVLAEDILFAIESTICRRKGVLIENVRFSELHNPDL
jgi:hypothetical protein